MTNVQKKTGMQKVRHPRNKKNNGNTPVKVFSDIGISIKQLCLYVLKIKTQKTSTEGTIKL